MKSHMMERRAELSALFDDEAVGDAELRTLAAVPRDPELQDSWRLYAVIGDCLRGESMSPRDSASAVMARLRHEPVVLAPRPAARGRHHPSLALAASLAGVAVVGWLAWVDGTTDPGVAGHFAAVPPAPTFVTAQIVRGDNIPTTPAAERAHSEMNEYLFAHHMQTSAVRLGDGTERVRTISRVAGVARP